MTFDVKNIGVFGVSFSAGFDQTWVNLWRKDDHYSADIFAMLDDDDPVKEERPISLEEGEHIIAQALQNANIEQWDTQYDDSASEKIPGLSWTLDIDDLDEADLAMYSGNNGIPPRQEFDALIEAMRIAYPTFAEGLECLEN